MASINMNFDLRQYEIQILFTAKTPKNVALRTLENMETYGMNLSDAFEEAARTLSKPNTELWAAWYFCDYRKYIPSAYTNEALNLKKNPMKYIRRSGVYQARYHD